MRSIQGSRVVVVGGAGFLGSHLVDYLIEARSCKVRVLDNLCTGNLNFLHSNAEFIYCDITHPRENIVKLLEGSEYVFNYAAEPYIPVSFDRPLHVFDVNAVGALRTMEASKEVGCEGMLQVSSAELYGANVSGKINEEGIVAPRSSYGASKAAIDFAVQARWREDKVKVISLRQFNCVGERETHPYVVPEIISQLHRPDFEGVINLGNNTTRDFQYAGDAVAMAVELLEKGQFGEFYNMGSEETIQVYDLAKLLGNLCGKSCRVEVDKSRIRPWDIWHLQSDNTKLYKTIDRRPKVSLEEALSATIGYYRNDCNQLWGWE